MGKKQNVVIPVGLGGGWECVGMGCGKVEYSYGYDLASYFPRSTLSSKKE